MTSPGNMEWLWVQAQLLDKIGTTSSVQMLPVIGGNDRIIQQSNRSSHGFNTYQSIEESYTPLAEAPIDSRKFIVVGHMIEAHL